PRTRTSALSRGLPAGSDADYRWRRFFFAACFFAACFFLCFARCFALWRFFFAAFLLAVGLALVAPSTLVGSGAAESLCRCAVSDDPADANASGTKPWMKVRIGPSATFA